MEDLENVDRDGYDDDHEDAPIVNKESIAAAVAAAMAVANSMRPPPPPPPMTDEEEPRGTVSAGRSGASGRSWESPTGCDGVPRAAHDGGLCAAIRQPPRDAKGRRDDACASFKHQ